MSRTPFAKPRATSMPAVLTIEKLSHLIKHLASDRPLVPTLQQLKVDVERTLRPDQIDDSETRAVSYS
jgi:hypothetical protein